MKHFIYKTTHKNGKYYIGRHSTENIDDGYIGSGRWPLSIKDKSSLKREILEFVDNENELIQREGEYLLEHYGKPNCMNQNPDPVGFAAGKKNPMKDPKIASKISGENHYMRKDPIARHNASIRQKESVKLGSHNLLGDKNPNKDGRNAKLAYKHGKHNSITNNPSTINAKNGTHHWQNGKSPNYNGKLNKKLVEEGRHNFLGPEQNKKRIEAGTHNFLGSEANMRRLAEGKHPSQQKKTCVYCDKTVSIGMHKRWHGKNCKIKPTNMSSRQYEDMRKTHLNEIMKKAGITEYLNISLSLNQQEYEVTLRNGKTIKVPSELPYHYD
jgi:hypothetical protein